MGWIVDLFNKLIEFLYRLIISLVDMIKDVFIWALDEVLGLCQTLVDWVFSFFAPIDISQYLTSIPSEVSWMLSAIGLPQCLTIILASLVARLLLQLIPFTRLGS
ncbi:DUF2523 family protein [Vibrio sp. 99-70-13A1]|uniref:DUF2523 family protein n=1 Tax=Vibrio gallaecicus TaxID=552386 RepID=A0ABV4NGI4_9VIBR|nr:DUF2523 family protein [Vibrio sp. 99-70-13A1]NOH96290.1 DUF2523 domain-containing protein [Vibrio sp. 99-70-13A1]